MRLNKILLVLLPIGLLLMSLSTPLTNASVVGNTYNFLDTWLDQLIQENNGPIYHSVNADEFQVTVYNISQAGGDDIYEYNFNGFDLTQFRDHNDTVAFQNNKVHFFLFTVDEDGNNRSESTSLLTYPLRSTLHPGRHLFVNPIWSTHNTDWYDDQFDVEHDATVNQALTTFSNTEDGTFAFTVVVNVEDTVLVLTNLQNVTGTYTYTFSAFYDPDGVLLNWIFTNRIQLSNENYTLDQTLASSTSRVGGVGPTPAPIDPALLSSLIIAGVALPVGLIIGVFIGKRKWG